MEDGGPAFPTKHHDDGMTLRDYFAAKAMESLILVYGSMAPSWTEVIPKSAYSMADEMLKERSRT